MFAIAHKTLSDFKLTVEQYQEIYESCKKEINEEENVDFSDLDVLFKIAVDNLGLFTKINLPARNLTASAYLKKWIRRYISEISNLPSNRQTKKSTTPKDAGLKKMVKAALNLVDEEAENAERYHTVFMNAENVQGNLLEEYINSKAKYLGWIWCAGNIFRAVDFCKLEEERSLLLQIKVKYNTENSSSSAIREGTSIEKWERISSQKDGEGNTIYNWDKLNEIMKTTEDNKFSEEDYQNFLKRTVEINPEIIYNND